MAITEFPIFTKKFEELEPITDAQSTDSDGVMLYDDSVGVMKRMTKGELFKGKVIPIDDITGFLGIDYLQVSDRQQYHLNSFAPGGESGGGSLMWSSTLPKIMHDGVRYFSPTVPMPADFDNEQDVQDYKDGVGEEFPADLGIFVLTSFSIQSSEFPAVDGAIVIFDGISGNRVKNGPVPSEIGASLIESPPVEEVSYHRLNADGTVTARNTVEHKTDLQLDNVDNTSDADKPISDAVQAALDDKAGIIEVDGALELKADLESPAFTGNPTAPTPDAGDDSQSIATTEYVQGELSDRVQSVATIADLIALDNLQSAKQYPVAGWWSGSNRGGGVFIWRPSFNKSLHNGGSVISPTVPFVTAQAGASINEQLAAYIASTGETDPGGTGCFVRQSKRRYRLEDFGHQTGQDASVALVGVIKSGNKMVGLFAGDYLFSPTTFTGSYASLDIQGCGDGVAYTAITRLLPFQEAQSHLFSPEGGCNAVKFSKLHFNGLDDCDFGVYQTQGAGWIFEDVSGNDFLDTCLYSEQGLNRYERCFIRGGEGRAVVAYSDFAMDMCEFAGGTVPLTITAGGGRIGKIWLNSGTEACLDIYPRTSGTTHINTSIESLYTGETFAGASTAPIIRVKGLAAQKVRQIQISNLHIVCAQANIDHINTMIVGEYADDVTISNVAALGFGDFGNANKYTDGFLRLTDCLDWTIAGGVVADINKHPVRLIRSNVSFGDTLVFKDWGDPLATGDEKVCIQSDADSRVRISDTQFSSNRIADGIAGKAPSANRWRIGKVGLNIAGGGSFVFADNLGSWESHVGSDPATFIRGRHVTQYGQFSSLAGGGVTAMFTLANVAVDQSYHITVQQVGNASNGTSGILIANGSTAGVITTGNTNAGATLQNTFSLSGLGVRFNVGTGYGATTWVYQITQML